MKNLIVGLVALGSISAMASDCVLDLKVYNNKISDLGYNPTFVVQNKDVAEKIEKFNKILSDKNIHVSQKENSSYSNVTIQEQTSWGEYFKFNSLTIVTPNETVVRKFKTKLDFQVQVGESTANKADRKLFSTLNSLSVCD